MKTKILVVVGILIIVILAIFAFEQSVIINRAHSTFERYYAFRGCNQLIKRTDTYGICKIDSGQTIKIVKFKGRWYLDGDLPICPFSICL